jgi:hypothetical protein
MVETHTSRQVRPKRSGIPCAVVLRLLRALPGVPGFLATVARGIFRELDSSVGESEPHGLTVRIVPHVLRRNASIAARTTIRDDRETPLMRAGWQGYAPVFRFSQRGIFLRWTLDIDRDL